MKRMAITALLAFAVAVVLPQVQATAAELPKIDWICVSTETTPNHHTVQDVAKLAEAVSKRTGGRFSIRVALEGELGFKRDSYVRAIQRNQVQVAQFDPGWLTAQMPHLGVFNLTFLQDGTLEQLMKIEQATREMTLQAFTKVNVWPIAWYSLTTQELISRDPITDFTDLKGMKVRIWRELDAKLIERMKGVPVYMPGSEVYSAMQRGVVSAVNTGTPAMVDRSLQEVGKYLYRFGGPPASHYLVVNVQALDALPNEYKRALFLEGWNLTDRGRETVERVDGEAVAKMKTGGLQEYKISPEQRTKLIKLAAPLWDEWGKQTPENKAALDAAKKALGL
jgi:TRAP-type C4-dicarboxylate transport system substrate-binding protein